MGNGFKPLQVDKRISSKKAAGLCSKEGCQQPRMNSYTLCEAHRRESVLTAVRKRRQRIKQLQARRCDTGIPLDDAFRE